MKLVARAEVLEIGKYEELRDAFRRRVIEEKKHRRVALGEHMSVLFENHDTVLFQIQEMLRTERITSERAIQHEIETYNELVPGPSELSATIFIEYAEREERERMLVELAGIDDKFWIEVFGERSFVVPDRRNERKERTLAVHYVKFPLSPSALEGLRSEHGPVRLGVEHAHYSASVELRPEVRAALAEDLAVSD